MIPDKFANVRKSIELAKTTGKTVRWTTSENQEVFDAIVGLHDPPYSYSIAVKCIESETPISSSYLRDLFQPTENTEFSLIIVVSENGFEEPCRDVGTNSIFRLLDLESVTSTSAETLVKIFDLLLNQFDFRFRMCDGRFQTIPDEPGILKSLLTEILIETPNETLSLANLLNSIQFDVYKKASGAPKIYRIEFPNNTTYIHPNSSEKVAVAGFEFTYELLTGVEVSPHIPDNTPYMIDAIFESELRKRNQHIALSDVRSGKPRMLQAGKFYYNPNLLFSYYCETSNRKKATMVLVESYQSGTLFQARVKLRKSETAPFIEITNDTEIGRLAEMYESYLVSFRNLMGRFESFLSTVKNGESIDKLNLSPEQKAFEKADYFFEGREVICELKSIETDSFYKIEKILEPYKKRPEWPFLVAGTVGLNRIIERFPDKDEINRRIVDAITDSIERLIRKADGQIRDTKRSFSLPTAGGLLIILNDLVFTLSPDIVAYRIGKALNKKTRSGEAVFSNIAGVLLIHTAHTAELEPGFEVVPLMGFSNPSVIDQRVIDFTNKIMPLWARFEGIPLVQNEWNDLNIKFKPNRDSRASNRNKQ